MLHFARWKIILILLISIGGILLALPNLIPSKSLDAVPGWIPHKQINLGLDLQGGAHLLYQMDEKELVQDWLKNVRGDMRDVLRKERIGYTGLRVSQANKSVGVRVRDEANFDKAFTALSDLSVPLSSGLVFTGQVGIIWMSQRMMAGRLRLKSLNRVFSSASVPQAKPLLKPCGGVLMLSARQSPRSSGRGGTVSWFRCRASRTLLG